MIDKITTAAEAVADIKDGSLVAANFWGPGTPLYLWRALAEQGAKDLTVCINNYVPRPVELRERGMPDAALLLPQTKKIISGFCVVGRGDGPSPFGVQVPSAIEIVKRIEEGTLEFEGMSHGIFIERLMAAAMGHGGFYSPIGVGTSFEQGREKRVINGVEYILHEPIVPDVGLISAAKADKLGNLVYHGTARAANPIIAMASRYTVAEVFEIVEPGELDPDTIVTPAVFVDRVVLIPEGDIASKDRRIERLLANIEFRQRLMAAAEAAQGGNQ